MCITNWENAVCFLNSKKITHSFQNEIYISNYNIFDCILHMSLVFKEKIVIKNILSTNVWNNIIFNPFLYQILRSWVEYKS